MDAELRHKLDTIHTDLITRLSPLEELIRKHDSALYGNGHDGLIKEMEQVKTRRKWNNALFSFIGLLFSGIFGVDFWRWITGK